MLIRDTAAMAASASPRKPIVPTRSRSSRLAILLVAWRSSASGSSSFRCRRRRRHADAPHAACSSCTSTARRARVHGVLEHFLEHRGGTLDHLAGGDLVDEVVGEFGNVPFIKNNLTAVIFAIIGISVLPLAIGWWQHRRGVAAAQKA
jgi:hypothetical protein